MSRIDRPTPNQSYLVKQMQIKIAACLAELMHSLGNKSNVGHAAYKDPLPYLHSTGGWSPQKQEFWLRGGIKGNPDGGRVIFRNTRWGPDSKVDYGPKNLDQQVFEVVPDKTKLIQNGTDGDLHVAYEEEVGLTNSFSSSITKGVSLDMSASASSETTISGEYAGVKAEEKVALSFGIDRSSSKEEQKEEGEEGSHNEKLGIEFDAESRKNYLVEISYKNAGYSQAFNIDGIQDFDIELQMVHANHPNVKVEGIDGLLQFLYGYDTDYAWMQGQWDGLPWLTKDAMDWAQQPENRRIQVAGINHASLDSKPTYNVQELGNDIPVEYQHLPVEDAQQYQEEA